MIAVGYPRTEIDSRDWSFAQCLCRPPIPQRPDADLPDLSVPAGAWHPAPLRPAVGDATWILRDGPRHRIRPVPAPGPNINNPSYSLINMSSNTKKHAKRCIYRLVYQYQHAIACACNTTIPPCRPNTNTWTNTSPDRPKESIIHGIP